VTPSASGYTATLTNSTISTGFKTCTVTVGSNTATDGVITCS
jgi:hypothetical protein